MKCYKVRISLKIIQRWGEKAEVKQDVVTSEAGNRQI